MPPSIDEAFAALLYPGLYRIGLTALVRRVRNAGVVLCYHNVVSAPEASPTGAPGAHMLVDRFRGQMRWLTTRTAMPGPSARWEPEHPLPWIGPTKTDQIRRFEVDRL